MSYKQIARALIMATGDTHKFGPANFYRTDTGQREQAEFASELFMGSRLRCANCHNHPLDRWTQDDYHGLAAIFAKVDRGRVVGEKLNGQTIHPRTLEPAIQRIPGKQFLAENAKREGVVSLDNGLQYEVVKMCDGAKHQVTDKVYTHYDGMLIDGTVFDSSVERGQPIEFPLNRVIRGWTEILQLMPVGSKWRVYIPYDLAYGAQGAGGVIAPYSTLIFDIELIEIR